MLANPLISQFYGTAGADHVGYTNKAGTISVLAMAVSGFDNHSNIQQIAGTYNGAPVAGTLLFHNYDRATDTGNYGLSALVDPSGAGLPMLADVTVSFDRFANVFVITIDGSVGGTPVQLGGKSITNPFYGGI